MPKSDGRRKRRTKAQWTEIFRRCDESGLSVRQFCSREGLAVSSLQRWRGLMDRAPVADFVDLTPPSIPETPSSTWALEVSLPNGVRLQFRG